MTRSGLRRDASVFAAGAILGFLAGALLVFVLAWRYERGAATRLQPDAASAAARWNDFPTDAATAAEPHDETLEPVPSLSPPAAPAAAAPAVSAVPRDPAIRPAPASPADLQRRHLIVPVEGVSADQLTRTFSSERSGGREHEAIDILAPRNTPVRAVEAGHIAKLFFSKAGGITVYQFDPSEQYCYYYAHLERYAAGLKEGDRVAQGQVVGYVGTTGNAPENTPHLHFAIFRLTPEKHWWEGTAIDPYDVLHP